jgi:hypothetical protein
MAEVTLENVLKQVEQLPLNDKRKLRDSIRLPELTAPDSLMNRIPPGRRVPLVGPDKDRSRELAWLVKNQGDYAGQWLALDGDELIAHGYDLKQVSEEAKAKGVTDPIFAHAEDSNALPFAGWP